MSASRYLLVLVSAALLCGPLEACRSTDEDVRDPGVAIGAGGQAGGGEPGDGGSAGKGGSTEPGGAGGDRGGAAGGGGSGGVGGRGASGVSGKGGATSAGGSAGSSASGAGGAKAGAAGKGAAAGKGGNGAAGKSGSGGTEPVAGANVRVMAANLTTGNKQSYEAPGIRIMQAMKADVILIQELKVASGTVEQLVVDVCGAECVYYRGTGNIPNGVISRFPILESGQWADASVEDREFEWARIDLPGPRDLLAVSVHLLISDGPRQTQTADLVGYLKANAKGDEYVVLGGDFNTSSYEDMVFATLSEVLSVAAPHPADQMQNPATNTNRLLPMKGKPYDHVVASALLRAFEIPVVIGQSSFPAGLVVDTRVYSPIEDLAPALATDSGAVNMQHMGVVRDYRVPTE